MLSHTSTKITNQFARVYDMKVAVEIEKIKSSFSYFFLNLKKLIKYSQAVSLTLILNSGSTLS
jgi:hypothetical protein